MNSDLIISQTKDWIEKVVIGFNFCPFAGLPFQKNLVRYSVFENDDITKIPQTIIQELKLLEKTDSKEIETSFLVFPQNFEVFHNFLELVDIAENVLESIDLEGVIQVATFHPHYQFANTNVEDVENFTNRSPFPMLHFLRESSVSKAVMNYKNVEMIPNRNIEILNKIKMNGEMDKVLKWAKPDK